MTKRQVFDPLGERAKRRVGSSFGQLQRRAAPGTEKDQYFAGVLMLRFFIKLLRAIAGLVFSLVTILAGLVLSSLSNAAFAFFQAGPSREKGEILGTYDAQHALNEGTIDAPEYENYRERYED